MAERTVCELESADIPGALQTINREGIEIWDVVHTGELSIRFMAEKKSIEFLCDVVERRGDRLRKIQRLGLSRKVVPWMRHPLLLVGILLLLILTAWLPTRVLFIRVEGNQAVPSKLILEQAEECGIVFGSDRSAVRSERMKNALLEMLPQLQWAGINTTGCVATITVRERSVQPEEEDRIVSEVVASHDGIIRTCTVRNGTALCVPGQAVRAGEALISGLTDCGLTILVTGADGEIFAETNHHLTVSTPDNALQRNVLKGENRKFSLLLGKKRINLYNDSGILDTTCVKIYSEYYLTLPGGFRLPVGIGVETVFSCDAEDSEIEPIAIMEEYSRQYLLEHMTAGQILNEQTVPAGNTLYADYICLEMIGQNRYEEITKEDGKNYGENG